MNEVVLTAKNLARRYNVSRGAFREPAVVNALADASFTLTRKRTLAVVGEFWAAGSRRSPAWLR